MRQLIDRTGEVKRANNGMLMRIENYRSYGDIDVRFEDGTLVCHRSYTRFKNGCISNPNYVSDKVGEEVIATNGMRMWIIEYHNYHNVDVKFEDGTVVCHRDYKKFKEGFITNPNYTLKDIRIGETRKALNGMMMKIIKYVDNTNIDIEFEDGVRVYNKYYCNFLKGDIAHPDVKNNNIQAYAKQRIGEESISTRGMKMRIIAYRGWSDIDVQFEDGTIVCHKDYGSFKDGYISNPNLINRTEEVKESRVGKVFYTTKGNKKMEVIGYNGCNDVTVRLEDGSVIKGVVWKSLEKGYDVSTRNKYSDYNKYVGKEGYMNIGLKAKIIKYRSYVDVDVQFEDGVVVQNKTVGNFNKGCIPHPNFYSDKNGKFRSKGYLGFIRVVESFRAKGKVFFICTYKDESQDVLTFEGMFKKFKVKKVF